MSRQLESLDAGERILAIVALAEQAGDPSEGGNVVKKEAVIPLLVDRLEDEDEGVRFYAIVALEKLAGTDLGYHYGDPVNLRRRAVERWRQRVATQAAGAARERKGNGKRRTSAHGGEDS